MSNHFNITEAIKRTEEGKNCTRVSWGTNAILRIHEGVAYITYGEEEQLFRIHLSIDDLSKEDWKEV